MTKDAVTTLGSGVDGGVRRIEYAFDDAGRLKTISSYSAASGGTLLNQVLYAYNGLGQMVNEYQEHSGAVNVNSSPLVVYSYSFDANGSTNHSRLKSIMYPNGRTVRYIYSTGIDDTISRLSYMAEEPCHRSMGTRLEYAYLGLDTVIKRAHPESRVNLTYDSGNDTITGDGGDRRLALRSSRRKNANPSNHTTCLVGKGMMSVDEHEGN